MRKIEEQMIEAIKTRKGWHGSNTSVMPFGDFHADISLHGNRIANVIYRDVYANGYCVWPDLATFKRWPTRTTVSRLRALGINASVKNDVAMIDGQPV